MENMLKDDAWLGDAVLALWARQWLLDSPPPSRLTRQELFLRLTTNEFLQGLGDPTAVEARIGRIYRQEGLSGAFDWLETAVKPLFLNQLNKHERANRGRK